MPNTYFTN